jgi:uncharacterized protein (DUF305 family)
LIRGSAAGDAGCPGAARPPIRSTPQSEDYDTMTHRFIRPAAPLAALALAFAGVAGASTAVASTAQTAKATANATDRAFVREMIPHHQMATEMAKMAEMQAQHAQIRTLAKSIIKTQSAEITRLKSIAKTLGVKPASMPANGKMSMQTMDDLASLGVPMSKSGMTMKMSELDGAKPFDRKFIDMMIPHHQGAIRMARAEVAKGKNAQLRTIARGIITAQAKEIVQMNAWRKAWYGKTSPAGGVPTS